MRSHEELAYAFPEVDAATAFAGALRTIVKALEGEIDIEPDSESFHAMLEATGSEVRQIERRKRVVRFDFVVHDDGCYHASEAARERGEDRDCAQELEASLQALVAAHGGAEWRKGFEAVEASAPALAALREAGSTAFAILEAPPKFVLNGFGEVSNVYGDRALRMVLLGSPPELSLVGRWRARRGEQELGTWSGTLNTSTLTLDREGDDPNWKAGDLVVYEPPPPGPPQPTGLLDRLKGLFGG